MLNSRVAALGVLLMACGSPKPPTLRYQKTTLKTGTTARLQAISVPGDDVVWVSGLEGTVLRSIDGGASWTRIVVPDSSALQFRDVHAFDQSTASLLSSGDGPASRIYRTKDGGRTWALQFTMPEPKGFLDCFDFWDSQRGIAYGDSVNGRLYILRTDDGGETWERIADDAMPPAGPGEGGFAASGGCVRVAEGGRAWIATGAGGNARVLRSVDWGRSWEASETPLETGIAAGIMTIVSSPTGLLALGGDLESPDAASANRTAMSKDGGKTWSLTTPPGFSGAIYGAAIGGSLQRPVLIATGPQGSSFSIDEGAHWRPLSAGDFWSVEFGGPLRFWLVGPEGHVVRFDIASQ